MDVNAATSLLSALMYGQLVLIASAHWRGHPSGVLLVGALAATGLWALSVALGSTPGTGIDAVAGPLEAVRSAAWVLFLVWLRWGALAHVDRRRLFLRLGLPVTALGIAVAVVDLTAERDGALFTAGLYGHLLLATGGLVLLEAVTRRTTSEGRRRFKYLGIGVGTLLVFDFFLYSEAVLLGAVDTGLAAARGPLSAVAAPLIAVAASRAPAWTTDVRRTGLLLHHPVALTHVGVYMLALAGAGFLLRAFDREWGAPLHVTFLFASVLLLALILFSDTLRDLVRRRAPLVRLFSRPRRRDALSRFLLALSPEDADDLPRRALRALADAAESPAGALWLLDGDAFVRVARLGLPGSSLDEPAEGPLAVALAERGEAALQGGPGSVPDVGLPEWLRSHPAPWVLAPLVHRDALSGFAVLVRPGSSRPIDAETLDTLLACARHAAAVLSGEQAARSLEETRRFRGLSERVSFAAHDLRNLAEGLSLTLENARKHIREPDFQDDLLASMEDSVAGMRRLLDRVGDEAGDAAFAPASLCDLAGLVQSAASPHLDGKPQVSIGPYDQALPVAGDPDRLAALAGHLICNAVDAVGPDGRVQIRVRREAAVAVVEVEDDGPGMAPEIVHDRLAHPFASSKPSGYGIGLYECRAYADELGGRLEIDSVQGQGTCARLSLPRAPSPSATESG